jgi:multidrug efflux pump subunit AcrA (membrane-fusion protein)
MAIDVHPETHSCPEPPRSRRGRDRQDSSPYSSQRSSQGRWWRRGLLAIGILAALVSAGALIFGRSSSREIGPRLTYTITRGDLLVAVTEEGTLESSENTEIKCKVRGRNTVIWVIESGAHVDVGDELIRLDSLFIEEQINERSKYAHWSRSAAERSEADVARATLAVSEYEEGRYVSELMTLEKDLAIAESNLLTARNMLSHAKTMAESGYVSELEVEEKEFGVSRAKMEVEVKTTEIDILNRFTKAEQLQTLNGNLLADTARHAANAERAIADASRRDRAVEEFKHCVIKAERGGLVIHPNAAKWESAPIAEGSTVHKDQVLLLMPDLSKMQVKVGIQEAIINRVKPGMTTRVTLPNTTLDGKVSSVASVTRPASWWNGNLVTYDTIIQLPAVRGLTPGMSAEVEVLITRHEDVLTIPVAAIVETEEADFCWVKTATGTERRTLELGDSNDVFTIVKAGLKEGDEVVLNPIGFKAAKTEAPLDPASARKQVK